ncbi:hypothetical protein G6F56_009867 [Rhizopus delemar]|nr:hypothetical protein G6F56_009867 [Rhizopus delemar]
MVCHVLCLAKEWTKELELVPLQGECLKCKKLWSWGDLIRISKLKEVSLLDESSYKDFDNSSDEGSDKGSDENLDENYDGVSDASSSSSVINLTDQN